MSTLTTDMRLLLNVLSFAAEYGLVIYFFRPVRRREGTLRRILGLAALAAVAWLYFQPRDPARDPVDQAFFSVQLLRLLYYFLAVWAYLALTADKKPAQSCYLSLYYVFFYGMSRIYKILASQLPGQIGWMAPRAGVWGFGLSLAVLGLEWFVGWVVHRLVALERIDRPEPPRFLLVISVNLLSVYFRYTLIAQSGAPRQDLSSAVWFPLLAGLAFEAFMVFFESWQTSEEERKLLAMQKAIRSSELAHTAETAENAQHIRQIYHDMKNHLLAIRSMDGGNETQAYIDSILGKLEPYEDQIRTGLPYMDAYLSEKLSRLKRAGVRCSVALDLSGLAFMEPVDLISIVGNGVDNALEALQKMPEEDRLLVMKSFPYANMTVLQFTNPFNGELRWNGALPATLKRDRENHGIGLRTVEKAAGHYHGSVTIEPDREKKQFRLSVMIPVPTEKEGE